MDTRIPVVAVIGLLMFGVVGYGVFDTYLLTKDGVQVSDGESIVGGQYIEIRMDPNTDHCSGGNYDVSQPAALTDASDNILIEPGGNPILSDTSPYYSDDYNIGNPPTWYFPSDVATHDYFWVPEVSSEQNADARVEIQCDDGTSVSYTSYFTITPPPVSITLNSASLQDSMGLQEGSTEYYNFDITNTGGSGSVDVKVLTGGGDLLNSKTVSISGGSSVQGTISFTVPDYTVDQIVLSFPDHNIQDTSSIAIEPPDSDGDGVVDPDDDCPNTSGSAPDGCKDDDGDDVSNPDDTCPNLAGSNSNGCPDEIWVYDGSTCQSYYEGQQPSGSVIYQSESTCLDENTSDGGGGDNSTDTNTTDPGDDTNTTDPDYVWIIEGPEDAKTCTQYEKPNAPANSTKWGTQSACEAELGGEQLTGGQIGAIVVGLAAIVGLVGFRVM